MDESIDRNALARLLDVIGGDPQDLEELVADYLVIAPGLAATISAAAAAGDLDEMRIAAHTLKSNAHDFGALRLSALCAVLEQQCRVGAAPDAAATASAIVAAEAEARSTLAALDLGA